MIRGQRTKVNIIDDPIPCPNCGNPLTYIDGVRKCTSCEYELTINEIDYTQRHTRYCMICWSALNQDELQICKKCKEKIKNSLEVIK